MIVCGSNLKPDCVCCQHYNSHHRRHGMLTAPTAIVCVATAVDELEAVEASMAVGRVVLEELDVDLVDVCASAPKAKALMPARNDDESILSGSPGLHIQHGERKRRNSRMSRTLSSHLVGRITRLWRDWQERKKDGLESQRIGSRGLLQWHPQRMMSHPRKRLG